MRECTGPLCLPASLSLTTKTSSGHTCKHKYLYALDHNYTHTSDSEPCKWLRGCAGIKRVTEIWEEKNAKTWTGSLLHQLHFLPICCQIFTCFLSLPTSILHSFCPSLIALLPFSLTQLLMQKIHSGVRKQSMLSSKHSAQNTNCHGVGGVCSKFLGPCLRLETTNAHGRNGFNVMVELWFHMKLFLCQ